MSPFLRSQSQAVHTHSQSPCQTHLPSAIFHQQPAAAVVTPPASPIGNPSTIAFSAQQSSSSSLAAAGLMQQPAPCINNNNNNSNISSSSSSFVAQPGCLSNLNNSNYCNQNLPNLHSGTAQQQLQPPPSLLEGQACTFAPYSQKSDQSHQQSSSQQQQSHYNQHSNHDLNYSHNTSHSLSNINCYQQPQQHENHANFIMQSPLSAHAATPNMCHSASSAPHNQAMASNAMHLLPTEQSSNFYWPNFISHEPDNYLDSSVRLDQSIQQQQYNAYEAEQKVPHDIRAYKSANTSFQYLQNASSSPASSIDDSGTSSTHSPASFEQLQSPHYRFNNHDYNQSEMTNLLNNLEFEHGNGHKFTSKTAQHHFGLYKSNKENNNSLYATQSAINSHCSDQSFTGMLQLNREQYTTCSTNASALTEQMETDNLFNESSSSPELLTSSNNHQSFGNFDMCQRNNDNNSMNSMTTNSNEMADKSEDDDHYASNGHSAKKIRNDSSNRTMLNGDEQV